MIVDKAGFCIHCGVDMRVTKVLGGKVVNMLSPLYSELTFALSDGSTMRVAVCKPCKSKIKDKDYSKIMNSVIAGWEEETKNLNWHKDKKDKYMKFHKTLKIKERLK